MSLSQISKSDLDKFKESFIIQLKKFKLEEILKPSEKTKIILSEENFIFLRDFLEEESNKLNLNLHIEFSDD